MASIYVSKRWCTYRTKQIGRINTCEYEILAKRLKTLNDCRDWSKFTRTALRSKLAICTPCGDDSTSQVPDLGVRRSPRLLLGLLKTLRMFFFFFPSPERMMESEMKGNLGTRNPKGGAYTNASEVPASKRQPSSPIMSLPAPTSMNVVALRNF